MIYQDDSRIESLLRIADYIINELGYNMSGEWVKKEDYLSVYYERTVENGICQMNVLYPPKHDKVYGSMWITFKRKTMFYRLNPNLTQEENFILGVMERL